VHNLKYYTWVEQQGRTYEELMAQWYDPDYWTGYQSQVDEIDNLITEFNDRVGLVQKA
jgi:isocitrate dehydrogenase kinase/phosphatase